MTLLLSLPETETINFECINEGSNWYDDKIRTTLVNTPYGSSHQMEELLKSRGIRVPFDSIITRDQGESVCQHCKAKFAGHQPRCTNIISWMKLEDSYSWDRGNLAKHSTYRSPNNRWIVKRVLDTKQGQCGYWTTWNLEKQFDEQTRFFEFVNFIGNIDLNAPSALKTYRETLPPGSADEYRILFLEQELSKARMELTNAIAFIEKMAEKMNAAGHNLSF